VTQLHRQQQPQQLPPQQQQQQQQQVVAAGSAGQARMQHTQQQQQQQQAAPGLLDPSLQGAAGVLDAGDTVQQLTKIGLQVTQLTEAYLVGQVSTPFVWAIPDGDEQRDAMQAAHELAIARLYQRAGRKPPP
jgi:hypothetical protein